MQANQSSESAGDPVISPFSDAESPTLPRRNRRTALWAALAILLALFISAGGFFLVRHLKDPFRTLESFPVAKYLDNYKSLAGSKFRADLRVENDLGWKEGTGRLMVFSLRDEPRPIVVMIPPSLAQNQFESGLLHQILVNLDDPVAFHAPLFSL